MAVLREQRARKQRDHTVGDIARRLDVAEIELRIAIVNALTAARDSTEFDELVRLVDTGRVDEAIERAARIGAIRISDAYAAVYVASGRETSEAIEDALRVVIGFDQTNERAVRHLRDSRFRMIVEFGDAQRDATRLALVDATARGLNPVAQARAFRASVGLTRRQQAAVVNYRTLLERAALGERDALTRALRDRRFDPSIRRAIRTGEPLTGAHIDRMVARYGERYVKFRAETIARTEALRAVHAGNDEAFRQAVAAGALDPTELVRTWITSLDGRERATHHDASGQTRGLDEPFSVGGWALRYPGDPAAPARETIRCRCVLTTRFAEDVPDGTPSAVAA